MIQRDDPAIPSTGTPELRVGHKGLFFDRLDAGVLNPSNGADTPRLVPGARLLGYARNRTLMSDLGRWMQPDPNGTGLFVRTTVGIHATQAQSGLYPADLTRQFSDGANLSLYLRGRPLAGYDPLGLQALAVNPGRGAGTASAGVAVLAGALLLFQVDQYGYALSNAAEGALAYASGNIGWGDVLFDQADSVVAMLAGDTTVLMTEQADAVRRVQSYLAEASEHLDKLDGIGPGGNRDDDGWYNEIIYKWVTPSKNLLKRMGTRTAREMLEQIESVERRARILYDFIKANRPYPH